VKVGQIFEIIQISLDYVFPLKINTKEQYKKLVVLYLVPIINIYFMSNKNQQ